MNIQSVLHPLQALFGSLFPTYAGRDVSKEYAKEIQDLANNRVNRRFLNDSHAQAVLIVSAMISRVRKSDPILIYSRSLEPKFYNEILHSSERRFKIVLNDAHGATVIESLRPEVRRRVQYRLTVSGGGAHFLVAGNALRYEAREGSGEMFVICNFHEPESTGTLRDRFRTLWDKAPLRPSS